MQPTMGRGVRGSVCWAATGLAVIGAVTLSGCGGSTAVQKETEAAMELVELKLEDVPMVESQFRRADLVSMRLAKLSESERAALIHQQIAVLRTPMWREARMALIQIGRESVPYLIATLDRQDESAAAFRPRPGPQQNTEQLFNTHGDVAWLVLRDMIGYYSNYSGRVPERDRKAWAAWWKSYRRGLVIYGRRVRIGTGKRKSG